MEAYKDILRKHDIRSLGDAQAGPVDTVYAQVVGHEGYKRSNAGARDYNQKIYITDPTLNGQSVNLMVFKNRFEKLPQVDRGRFILLKNITMNKRAAIQPVANNLSTIITFDPSDLTAHTAENVDCLVTEQDMDVIRELRAAMNKVPSPVPVSNQKPVLQTDALVTSPAKFFDYVGMIVGYYPDQNNRAVTNLVLTDYTVNPKPYLTDEDGVRGIECNLLLQCTLWDNHAEKCPVLHFGDFVYLKNCIRNLRQGILEISIKGNKDSKNHVLELDRESTHLVDLLKRKDAYTPIPPMIEGDTTEIQDHILTFRTKRTNPAPLVTLDHILKEKKEGLYSIRAYIADYQPKNTRDWVRGWCSSCKKTYDEAFGVCSLCHDDLEAIYQLSLLLQEDDTKLTTIVFHEDANTLFSGIPAESAFNHDESVGYLDQFIKFCTTSKLYFDFGVRAYDTPDHGLNYRITDTEFIADDN